jgi:hypothetical protein|tara:strand:+ start:691 stop:1368 length:678 start_codon:yes stop_codon:yes gene_type:complete
MASTYTPLGVEKMATGENAGTWGTKTNTNLQIIEQLTGGYLSTSIAGGAGDTALDVDDGALTGTACNRVIELTGAITGSRGVTIPLDIENWYIVKNSTTNANTVTFKYASGSGDTVVWSATDKGTKIIYATANDGTNPDIIDVMATSSDITLSNNNALKFNDADNSAAVGFKAPTTVSGAVTWTLPAADATTSGYALTSNASGTLSWASGGISTGKAIAMAMIFG